MFLLTSYNVRLEHFLFCIFNIWGNNRAYTYKQNLLYRIIKLYNKRIIKSTSCLQRKRKGNKKNCIRHNIYIFKQINKATTFLQTIFTHTHILKILVVLCIYNKRKKKKENKNKNCIITFN